MVKSWIDYLLNNVLFFDVLRDSIVKLVIIKGRNWLVIKREEEIY